MYFWNLKKMKRFLLHASFSCSTRGNGDEFSVMSLTSPETERTEGKLDGGNYGKQIMSTSEILLSIFLKNSKVS